MDVYPIRRTLKDDMGELSLRRPPRVPAASEKWRSGCRYPHARRKVSGQRICLWHVTLDFDSLIQVESAFRHVSSRADPVDSFRHAVDSKVKDVFFALYDDIPILGGSRDRKKF